MLERQRIGICTLCAPYASRRPVDCTWQSPVSLWNKRRKSGAGERTRTADLLITNHSEPSATSVCPRILELAKTGRRGLRGRRRAARPREERRRGSRPNEIRRPAAVMRAGRRASGAWRAGRQPSESWAQWRAGRPSRPGSYGGARRALPDGRHGTSRRRRGRWRRRPGAESRPRVVRAWAPRHAAQAGDLGADLESERCQVAGQNVDTLRFRSTRDPRNLLILLVGRAGIEPATP